MLSFLPSPIVLLLCLFNLQNAIASVDFSSLNEMIRTQLDELQIKLKREKLTENPTDIFGNIISILASEYRIDKCSEKKCRKACDNAEQFDDELRMAAEGFAHLAEKGKTDKMLSDLTKQFVDVKNKSLNFANLNLHFQSADDRRICEAFTNVLRALSSDLMTGSERDLINEFFQHGTNERSANCAGMMALSADLWIVMFPLTAAEGSKSDQNGTTITTDLMPNDQQHEEENKLRRSEKGSIVNRRRHKRHDLDKFKHIALLGVSLGGAYFVMTRLKTALEKSIVYFDKPMTILGVTVLMYFGTLYVIEKKFKKSDTKNKANEQKDKEEAEAKKVAAESMFAELVTENDNEQRQRPPTDAGGVKVPTNAGGVKMMDFEAYKHFMEGLYGRELVDIDAVRDHYQDYCKQMEQINGKRRPKTGAYNANNASSSMARKAEEYGNHTPSSTRTTRYGTPPTREAKEYGSHAPSNIRTTRYGNPPPDEADEYSDWSVEKDEETMERKSEKASIDKNDNVNEDETTDLSTDIAEYMANAANEQKVRRMMKGETMRRTDERKHSKSMANRELPMPGYYEVGGTKAKSGRKKSQH